MACENEVIGYSLETFDMYHDLKKLQMLSAEYKLSTALIEYFMQQISIDGVDKEKLSLLNAKLEEIQKRIEKIREENKNV